MSGQVWVASTWSILGFEEATVAVLAAPGARLGLEQMILSGTLLPGVRVKTNERTAICRPSPAVQTVGHRRQAAFQLPWRLGGRAMLRDQLAEAPRLAAGFVPLERKNFSPL